MKQTQEPGRRIVNMGEYAAVKIRKATLSLSSVLLVFAGMACLILACFSALYVVSYLLLLAVCSWIRVGLLQILLIALVGASSLLFGFLARLLARLSDTSTNRADKVENVVLLTRANTADLPAPDSLVRASQEPAQAQEGVLLRAAVGARQAGQEGQLLRASIRGRE